MNNILVAPPNNSMHSLVEISSETSTLSTTDLTYSTSHTIPGPGALSGKAIHALGRATLRGAEYLIVRGRFQVISSKFPHMNSDDIKGIERMYEEVLELSRFALAHANSFSNLNVVTDATYILTQLGFGLYR